jgi:anti-sigma-K factor RskA
MTARRHAQLLRSPDAPGGGPSSGGSGAIDRERLLALLADEQLGQLSPEDEAELESIREVDPIGARAMPTIAELALASAKPASAMPAALRERVLAQGRTMIAAPAPIPMPVRAASGGAGVQVSGPAAGAQAGATGGASGGGPSRGLRLAAVAGMAATVVLAGVAVMLAVRANRAMDEAQAAKSGLAAERARHTEDLRQAQAAAEQIVAAATARAEELSGQLAASERTRQELTSLLTSESARVATLASRVDEVQRALDDAQLVIARYETPIDPATIAANRTKLLELAGTVKLKWKPFDLPDAPAEQQGQVAGDVVWNDDLEQGFLRFVGLKPNDPAVEQYQLWVIDERGMEQKVSGGIFNANADGEIIVPITPAIDVRRVALFAVTIEEPGGTWVPDLRRRVVVAPRN